MDAKVIFAKFICAMIIYAIVIAITEHWQMSRNNTHFVAWAAGSLAMALYPLIEELLA